VSDSSPPREPLLDALLDICGPDHARVARPADAVTGRRAGFVAVPATTTAVADTLRLAADRGLSTLARGSGSKIDWGRPPAGVELLIDTARLGGLWNHDPTAGTAEVGTGTPVRALQAALALHGRRLPVDPPSRTATVGGMLAVNECGPLRHRYGDPAGHVERVTYVDAAGNAAESDGEGGRPGIAQIDGVLTSAVIRLGELPAARRWVGVAASNPLRMQALVEEAAGLGPSAIEVDLPRPRGGSRPGALVALFEGEQSEVAERADRLAAVWGTGTTMAPTAPPWWGRYPFTAGDVALRLSASAEDLPSVLYSVGDAVGAPVPIRGSAGLGSVHAVLPGTLPADRLESVLDVLRHVLMARHGRVVVVSAPAELARRVDMAGRRELF
jgi:glycolate dehydrogenase FAD-binding subunit